jgi:hypothetical protein
MCTIHQITKVMQLTKKQTLYKRASGLYQGSADRDFLRRQALCLAIHCCRQFLVVAFQDMPLQENLNVNRTLIKRE